MYCHIAELFHYFNVLMTLGINNDSHAAHKNMPPARTTQDELLSAAIVPPAKAGQTKLTSFALLLAEEQLLVKAVTSESQASVIDEVEVYRGVTRLHDRPCCPPKV